MEIGDFAFELACEGGNWGFCVIAQAPDWGIASFLVVIASIIMWIASIIAVIASIIGRFA
ncbi:hypothetical protein [Mesobacillus campisalis]|uniref:hypothetical protein n=1 Tax=Mesobacillus campisalis TaxID=1408103 RepID=UPI000B0BBCEB|nr:hypothetical protein [Mesobacillus campisalis]